VGQNRLFQNTGKGTFVDVTRKSGLFGRQAFQYFGDLVDYDRDGLLDLFVCSNYVNWSPEHDVFCSLDGKQKSYCTPESVSGETCWLLRNRGDGTFEDCDGGERRVLMQARNRWRGAAGFRSRWLARFAGGERYTAEQALNKNLRNGKFKVLRWKRGSRFSPDGKARAGMGVAIGDFEKCGAGRDLRLRIS